MEATERISQAHDTPRVVVHKSPQPEDHPRRRATAAAATIEEDAHFCAEGAVMSNAQNLTHTMPLNASVGASASLFEPCCWAADPHTPSTVSTPTSVPTSVSVLTSNGPQEDDEDLMSATEEAPQKAVDPRRVLSSDSHDDNTTHCKDSPSSSPLPTTQVLRGDESTKDSSVLTEVPLTPTTPPPEPSAASMSMDRTQVCANAARLANLLREADYCVAVTGAGFSTAAGIPDYRGTGGAYEGVSDTSAAARGKADALMTLAMSCTPTVAHLALARLVDEGLVQHVISQNIDGLHLKSGIPRSRLTEVHGNLGIEYCKKCKTEYYRDFNVRSAHGRTDHRTGRPCERFSQDKPCTGKLMDTIINFNEGLNKQYVKEARDQLRRASLVLVIGTSLSVYPLAQFVFDAFERHGAELVVCSVGPTEADKCEGVIVRAHETCDELFTDVMTALELPIPASKLKRRVMMAIGTPSLAACGAYAVGAARFTLDCFGPDDMPASFVKSVRIGDVECTKAPFNFEIPIEYVSQLKHRVELEFFGLYGEKTLVLEYEPQGRPTIYELSLHMPAREWVTDCVEVSSISTFMGRPALVLNKSVQVEAQSEAQLPPEGRLVQTLKSLTFEECRTRYGLKIESTCFEDGHVCLRVAPVEECDETNAMIEGVAFVTPTGEVDAMEAPFMVTLSPDEHQGVDELGIRVLLLSGGEKRFTHPIHHNHAETHELGLLTRGQKKFLRR